MTVKDIISSVPGVPYYNNVVDDWDSKDYSWGVTKKVIEYATYLKDHPESLAKLPPATVLNGKFEDGAHRVSAIWLLQQRMDPKNPLWKNAKLNIQFVKQGVAEGGAETSWSDGTEKITLQDILELTKHIKQINLPINDNLKSKLIHWDGNPEEIERINQVTVSNQFPILIIVDEQGQIKSILDGNHRLHKAIQSQAKTIPAKLIKPSDLNDKAKRIFHLKEQGVVEGKYGGEPYTYDLPKRRLNVPLLIQRGAIFVTYPHGDSGWETDKKLDWQFSLITLMNVEQIPWCKEAPKYRKPASYKKAEQKINSSAPNLGNDQLVYDGKYNQILWSIQKLGIPEEQAFLDRT
jgi:hypothetical protein